MASIKFLGRKREGVCYNCGREIKDVYVFEIDGMIEELGSECQKKVTGYTAKQIRDLDAKWVKETIQKILFNANIGSGYKELLATLESIKGTEFCRRNGLNYEM